MRLIVLIIYSCIVIVQIILVIITILTDTNKVYFKIVTAIAATGANYTLTMVMLASLTRQIRFFIKFKKEKLLLQNRELTAFNNHIVILVWVLLGNAVLYYTFKDLLLSWIIYTSRDIQNRS